MLILCLLSSTTNTSGYYYEYAYELSSTTKKGEIESATNPWVVLVILNNIQFIELMLFQDDHFRKFIDWHDMDQRCGPLKMLRTHIGKSSRLFILFSVIQDHIEFIGKPILLKGDEVLLNGLLAQVLSDIAPKPSTTFSF